MKGLPVKLTYTDLVRRLVDLERLAEPPASGEQGGCCSSYDRRSRYNSETGKYEEWDANDDGSGFIRMEGDWMVVFEREGPGVIWRIWSALPGDGHVQIFIDDAPEPVVDMPFRGLFERFNDEMPPLNFPSLTPTLSRGRNRYIPIPYNRSCKVRLAPEWGAYYHFTYTTFPPDTQLPVFTGIFDRDTCIALAVADRTLAQRGWKLPRSTDDMIERITVTVPPGTTLPICTLLGNRAITGMHVVPHDLPAPPEEQRVLRELALSITWDDDAVPSVWAPLGDFFGTAPGVNYYRSLPLGMTDGGFYSHWFMPFATRAQMTIMNDGETARTLTFQICHKPLAQSADQLLRFHAKWHRDAFLERAQEEGRDIDWPLLLVEGQGRFCGVHLHIWNRWAPPTEEADTWWYGRWNEKSIDWWWGEGDEKFFVDGEKFPSTFGTGSEDYVGYAWAAEPPFPTFDSAYASQPMVALDGNGHTSVSRFHICDDVPFHSKFEGYIEKYKGNRWGDGNVCFYAVVTYWYQRPGESDPYGSVPLAERVGYEVEPSGTR
ncbi:hypothetical protein SE17_00880 [Kouleothrix aurantiaca]|uniref:DUF2961 domain-containing protein n=1 Tax=Kouleothrix aurantiaca TaxID=186479 RepID=A0A0P9FNK3_9CHLR|nr:hypothetical protein SE17_00880 [Kouleothrix aurantiaca]